MTQDEAKELGRKAALAAKRGDWSLVKFLKKDLAAEFLDSYRAGYAEDRLNSKPIYFK